MYALDLDLHREWYRIVFNLDKSKPTFFKEGGGVKKLFRYHN